MQNKMILAYRHVLKVKSQAGCSLKVRVQIFQENSGGGGRQTETDGCQSRYHRQRPGYTLTGQERQGIADLQQSGHINVK